jgi:hypothetical protein
MRTIFATSVQHANAAATVLIKALSDHRPLLDPAKHLRALEVLTAYIRANATTYDAANKMMAQLETSPRGCLAASGLSSHPSTASTSSPTSRQKSLGPSQRNGTTPVVRSQEIDAGSNEQIGTGSPHERSTATANWPNFDNIMYANEIAFLSVDGPSENL